MMSIPVLITTTYAQQWLAGAYSIQTIYQGDKVYTFVDAQGRVLSMVTPEVGASLLNVVIPKAAFPFSSLTELDFSAAQLWNPVPAWEKLAPTPYMASLRGIIQKTYVTGSWGCWLLDDLPPLSLYQALIHESAGEAIQGLLQALSENRLDFEAVRKIAGMGEGLTPAGDDWLLGCMLALHLLQKSELAQGIASAASPCTTPLSAAYLRAAGEGACSIHWHHLLHAADESSFSRAALTIAHQGHTSGNSALAGFYMTAIKTA